MPKTDINYENTTIYKIYCKDPNVKELYIGNTTNFVQRKHMHKRFVKNPNCKNTKLYKVIQENGGWDNWIMEIVECFKCNNQYEAVKKEEEYFISLDATLKNNYKKRTELLENGQEEEKKVKSKEPNLELSEVKEIFSMMMKTNADFQRLMLESSHAMIESQNKFIENTNNAIVNNTTYNTNNTINNRFNLNFFLNDTCKDAMNIMDFVEMVKSQLNLKDFEAFENGYSNTISGLFLRGLEALEVNERPIHCTDLKREVIYVKNDNVWHLDSNQELVTKAVKHISHYNFKQYPTWQKENPASNNTNSKEHEYYMKLVRNCMPGGTDDEINDNYKKIIRNVMKEVVIDKKKYIK